MRLDPAVEEPVRDLLGKALDADLEAVRRILAAAAEAGSRDEVLTLTARVAGMAVVDLCDGQVPTPDDLREISATTAEIDEDHGLTPEEVHGFLERVVFGGERIDAVLGPDDAARVPFAVTSNLLGSTADVDGGQQWWDLLESIEQRIEADPDTS